jgi:hypothetical protein
MGVRIHHLGGDGDWDNKGLDPPARIEAGGFVVMDHGVEKAILSSGSSDHSGNLSLYAKDRRKAYMDSDETGFTKEVPLGQHMTDREMAIASFSREGIQFDIKVGGSIRGTLIEPGSINACADGFSTVIGRSETTVRDTGKI